MIENMRRQIDALELLMQDHREVESLFRDFNHLRQNRQDTGIVISSACAELRHHDTLETTIFYAVVDEATDDEAIQRLLDEAEDDHDETLESIERIEHTRMDPQTRDTHFAALAERVLHHMTQEEASLFPLVRGLAQIDLEAVAAAMKKRRAELMHEGGSAEANRETV